MKKTLYKIITLLFVAVLCVCSFASCGCKHEIGKWKIIKQETCTTSGTKQGVCTLCGEVVKQSIAPDPEKHVYNEWEIETLPTYEVRGTGKAVRRCSENSDHTIQQTLPRLTENALGYKNSYVTAEATVISPGVRTLVYEHETGDISFTVPIEKKILEKGSATEIADAVLLGSSSRSLVSCGEGKKDVGYHEEEIYIPPEDEKAAEAKYANVFNYVYGDGYLYTYDEGDRFWRWLSDNGEGGVFAVYTQQDPSRWNPSQATQYLTEDPTVSAEDLLGYKYLISNAGYAPFYGAEDLLAGSYEWGKKNYNKDFVQKVVTDVDNDYGEREGRYGYRFSFGYYNVSAFKFCQVIVEFTLTEEYGIDYIRLDCDTYTRGAYTVTLDEESGNAYCSVNKGALPTYQEFIYYRQTFKTADHVEPENPFGPSAFKVSSFDLVYNDGGEMTLTDDPETTITLRANGTKDGGLQSLRIKNVQPVTATLAYDPVTIYRITDTGRLIRLSYDFSNDYVLCYYRKDSNTLGFKSHLSGVVRLLLCTDSGYEKRVCINVTPIAPSNLYPSVYQYGDNGYTWADSDSKTISHTVYVGQSLTLKASLSALEKTYCDASYDAFVVGENKDYATLAERETKTDNVKFTATKAGTYNVRLRSTKDTNVTASVTVTVVDPPSVAELLSGVYQCKVNYPMRGDVTVTFSTEGETLLATVVTKKGTERVSIVYDAEKKALKTEHYDGASLGISFRINEAYRLVLRNPTGFGGAIEEVVMHHPEADEDEGNSGTDSGTENGAA